MDKSAIERYAVWARRELIDQVTNKAHQYGVSEEDDLNPEADVVNGRRVLSEIEKNLRKVLIEKIREIGYKQVIDEAAYTWFNRFAALRFMEVNGYLPSHVRVFTNDENEFKPQIISEAADIDLDGLDVDKVDDLKDSNKTDELYKYLLITQCMALSKILPGMFSSIGAADYTVLLMPDNLLREGSVIDRMISDINEEDWKDAVQIIGWLYQYYISEKHDEIVNIYKGTVKKEDVPAATQLFTTDWVVRYMVDNSVGRYWIERHQESHLAEKLKFFVRPKDGKIDYVNEAVKPQDITFLDPCMGSGHILAYAFDVFMEIYREYGYTDRDAVSEIIEHNLFGFDIDIRCTQLAYFVVMMKARQYDKGFFRHHIQPQVYCPLHDKELSEYGSLLQISDPGEKPSVPKITTLFDVPYEVKFNDWNCRRILSQKYAVVCTNPPYLNKYNPSLKSFVNENYKDYSRDLFSVYIYRNFLFCKNDGYSALMTPFVWMFIMTYEKLRDFIITQKSLTTLIQMEYSAFEEATVPICTFVLKNGKCDNKSLCFRLSDFKGGMDVQKQKVLEAIKNPNCGYFYETNQTNFKKVPGSPISYWLSDKDFTAFTGNKLDDVSLSKCGMGTSDNNRFLRFWFEVNFTNVGFHYSNIEQTVDCKYKWFPYNKGGEYRKWYGNHDYIVNFYNNGQEIRDATRGAPGGRVVSSEYYFKKHISWSDITSGNLAFRQYDQGFIFDVTAHIAIADEKMLKFIMGYANTKLVCDWSKVINPTIHFTIGNFKLLPFKDGGDYTNKVCNIVDSNVEISKTDWNSFETSWDFVRHPMIPSVNDKSASLAYHYEKYKAECEERFLTLQKNEEELNRIFIDIYGLQDELTPEVSDKDVTVYRIFDTKKDIPESMGSSRYALTKQDVVKSLISYAVGCMLGRYSLDADGLAYAGGKWDDSKYITFPADKDGILPICDDEYFDDDITGRFVNFISIVYGKENLEENLSFIADALGGKGTARNVIRSYFINDFYKDHCKTYQKRPIYWLFDSGKNNGFKALIYMHRYKPDTIALIRTDYVHAQQGRYRTAISNLERRINSASDHQEHVMLNKQLAKLKEQNEEISKYEEKIHNIADRMISIDLDDGVKNNYENFKDILAKIK